MKEAPKSNAVMRACGVCKTRGTFTDPPICRFCRKGDDETPSEKPEEKR